VRFVAVHFSLSKERRSDLFGYVSVNFGYVISAKLFAQQNNINFSSLDKKARFWHTVKLTEKLMNGIGYVTPVLSVPLIAQVFRQRKALSLTEIEIISAVHELIDGLIEQGAPLNAAEIPVKKTLLNALAQMTHYSMLETTDDGYCIVDSSSDLLAYYAASIAHWFNEVDHIDPQQHRLAT
jgi:hypothetical protein